MAVQEKKKSLEKEPACWEKWKSPLRKSSSYLNQSFTELLAAVTKQSHKRRGYNSLSVSWQIITQGKIFSGAEIAVHYACFLLLIIFLQQQNPLEVTRTNLPLLFLSEWEVKHKNKQKYRLIFVFIFQKAELYGLFGMNILV